MITLCRKAKYVLFSLAKLVSNFNCFSLTINPCRMSIRDLSKAFKGNIFHFLQIPWDLIAVLTVIL